VLHRWAYGARPWLAPAAATSIDQRVPPAPGTGASYRMSHAHSRYLCPRWAESLVHLHHRSVTETAHFTKSDEEPGCCGELCCVTVSASVWMNCSRGCTGSTSKITRPANTKRGVGQGPCRAHVSDVDKGQIAWGIYALPANLR
jgi:hypothetical protein